MIAPVLVQQALLLDEHDQPLPAAVEALVELARNGRPVVMFAARPERWRPTRNSMDRALSVQQSLYQALTRSGGDLDGVVYLDYGLFSRERTRASALVDLARRYRIDVPDLTVISGQARDLELAGAAGARALDAGAAKTVPGVPRCKDLREAIAQVLSK